jgi:hypothetical protein
MPTRARFTGVISPWRRTRCLRHTLSVLSTTHVPAPHHFSALGLTCSAFRLSGIFFDCEPAFPQMPMVREAAGSTNIDKAMCLCTKVLLPLTVPNTGEVACAIAPWLRSLRHAFVTTDGLHKPVDTWARRDQQTSPLAYRGLSRQFGGRLPITVCCDGRPGCYLVHYIWVALTAEGFFQPFCAMSLIVVDGYSALELVLDRLAQRRGTRHRSRPSLFTYFLPRARRMQHPLMRLGLHAAWSYGGAK